jgi:hypothetical protein
VSGGTVFRNEEAEPPMIVLQNGLRNRPEDPTVVRADLLPLGGNPKTPLDIYEARNAVRIARLAGAERYAAEPYHRVLQLLQQAESVFAHKKKGADIPEVKQKARQATEDARAVAVERGQETRPLSAPPTEAPDRPKPVFEYTLWSTSGDAGELSPFR